MSARRIVSAAIAASFFSACAGGTPANRSVDALPAARLAHAAANGTATVTFGITIPAPRSGQGVRRRHYVSPNTQSMTVSVNGGTPQPFGLTVATDPHCTGESAPIVCTGLTVQAPVGSDTFAFSLYEQPLSGGALPPGATLLSTYTTPAPIQIVEGAANSLGTFTLDGVPASIALSPGALVAPADGRIHVFTLAAVVKDASGATIIPPGDYTAPVSFSVSNDPHGAVSVSPAQLTGPPEGGAPSVTVTYDASKPLTSALVTAASTGATSGTAYVNPLAYALDSPADLVVGGSSRTLTVSEARYDGPFTISGAGDVVRAACSNALCKPAVPGGSVTISITGLKAGKATLQVSDANKVTASIPLAVIAPPTFGYTGSKQLFTVPNGVSSIRIDAYGAAGGFGEDQAPGGLGGQTTATVSVTAGEPLRIYVGGAGASARSCAGGAGGYNGGGDGGHRGGFTSPIFCHIASGGGGGGGGSDVRVGGAKYTDRIVVAGGGGGGSGFGHHRGGDGGELTGEAGSHSLLCSGGDGGTQTAGGKAGTCLPPGCHERGRNGTFLIGGIGGDGTGPLLLGAGGGAGGGGYYGGGGACGTSLVEAGAGGGGSSFAISGSTNVSLRRGVRSGNGLIVLTW